MHAYIVVSLMAGVRPEEARAIGWEEDVDLDGNPPSVAVLRADRAGGDTKTPRSRRALQLAQIGRSTLKWPHCSCPVPDKSARSTPSDLRGPFQVAKVWLLL